MASASIIMEEDSGNHYLNMLMQSQSILASMDGEAVIDAEIYNVSSVEIGKVNLHNCESCKKLIRQRGDMIDMLSTTIQYLGICQRYPTQIYFKF